jgi:hypothetical protein
VALQVLNPPRPSRLQHRPAGHARRARGQTRTWSELRTQAAGPSQRIGDYLVEQVTPSSHSGSTNTGLASVCTLSGGTELICRECRGRAGAD